MPSTRRGIYHNLRESKYTASNSEAVFYFSSELYLQKFLDRYKENRQKNENQNINFDTLSDVNLYLDVEKRGFFVRLMRAKITREDLYNYAIRKMSFKNSLDWYRSEGILREQKTKEEVAENNEK